MKVDMELLSCTTTQGTDDYKQSWNSRH